MSTGILPVSAAYTDPYSFTYFINVFVQQDNWRHII